MGPRRPVLAVLAVLLAGVGTALHLWYLFHIPLNSDQAVAGLVAQAATQGHFRAFYPGQVYGGTGEELVMAAVGGVAGWSALTVNGTVMALFAVAAVVTWRVARLVVADAGVAALAGALIWTCPLVLAANGTYAFGFRGLTMLCSGLILLFALRIAGGRRSPAEFAALGLSAGLGWWSSPEIVYFLVPAGLVLVRAAAGWRPRPREAANRMAVLAVTFAAGALPWIWANARSGGASLRTSSLKIPRGSPGYSGRLKLYFHYVLPMNLGLRHQVTGAWVVGTRAGHALYLIGGILLVAVLAVGLLRPGPSRFLAIGVIAYPFLLALLPDSRIWQFGRYGMYDWPLIVLAAASAVSPVAPPGRHLLAGRVGQARLRRSSFAIVAVGLCALAVVALHQSAQVPGTAWWSDPDDPTRPTVQALLAGGVRAGYADYWVAYRLDFLSGGRLSLTVIPPDPQRDRAVQHRVEAAADPAWVFVPVNRASTSQFVDTPDLEQIADAVDQAQLESYLAASGTAYRQFGAGLAQVVVPARAVPVAAVDRTPAAGG